MSQPELHRNICLGLVGGQAFIEGVLIKTSVAFSTSPGSMSTWRRVRTRLEADRGCYGVVKKLACRQLPEEQQKPSCNHYEL